MYTGINVSTILGSFLLAGVAGIAALAGLGGGGPSVVIYIVFFVVLPMDATMMVFASILGSSFGSVLTQSQTTISGKSMINYIGAYTSLPFMFIGAYIGILLNRLMPSLCIVAIIMFFTGKSLPNIYAKYQKSKALEEEQ